MAILPEDLDELDAWLDEANAGNTAPRPRADDRPKLAGGRDRPPRFLPAVELLAAMDRCPGASISRRWILRKRLTSSGYYINGDTQTIHPNGVPLCYRDDKSLMLMRPTYNMFIHSFHPLVGRTARRVDLGVDFYEGYNWCYWSTWNLLYRTGLIGFTLMAHFRALNHTHHSNKQRVFLLIVALRFRRLAERIARRASSLAAIALLADASSTVPAGPGMTPGHDSEPPPLRPPRAPGVDSPGLFAPLC